MARLRILSDDDFDKLYKIPKLNDQERELVFELDESDKNYLILNSSETNYRYRATITQFTKQLPDCFIQTHKGFIVNINFITAFSNTLIEIENNKIPISKTHKNNVLRILRQ